MFRILLLLNLVLLIPAAMAEERVPARSRLDVCIYMYENGEYEKAVDSLKNLIPAIRDRKMVAEAYKYLAFSSVMLDMINNAKVHFKKMLKEFPDMDIDTIQVPPNITVVFKQVKLEAESHMGARKRNTIISMAAGGVAAVTAGMCIYFYTSGADAYAQYETATVPSEITQYRRDTESYYRYGQISLVTSGLSLGAAVIMLALRPKAATALDLTPRPNGLQLSVRF